jgi:polyhydroxyalkanoate synthesis regulator phasin
MARLSEGGSGGMKTPVDWEFKNKPSLSNILTKPKPTGTTKTQSYATQMAKNYGYSSSTSQSAPSTSTPTSSGGGGGLRVASVGGGGGAVGGGGYAPPVDPLAEYKALAKKSSDAYYSAEEAGLGRTRDQALTDITKAYDDAIATGKMSEQEAQDAYNEAVKQIDAMAYRDSQLTQSVAFDRGIGNSQQLLGLMAGDNARSNNMRTDMLTERDKRINSLKDRIAQLTKQKDLDTAQTNSDYNYNLTQARANADKQYYDALMSASGGSGGGGGGGGSYKSSKAGNYDVSAQSNLLNSYKDFVQAKQQTALDDYQNRIQSVVRKESPLPYTAVPTVRDNPNMSEWEKLQILRNGLGFN